jgi:hypothetical protein
MPQPISLNDAEYDAVMSAAAPIHPSQRGDVIQALAGELERQPAIGPGVVHRIAADLQRRYQVEARRETSVRAEPYHRGSRTAEA